MDSKICSRYVEEVEKIKKAGGYLGELILSEDELRTLFVFLSKADLKSPNNIACLAVAAVNCAFYYYDEEGFWKHFDSSIGNMFVQSHDYFGNKILAFLKKNHFINIEENDFGSYRYVRPILLQSGISKKHVPRFSEFVSRLRDRYGLSSAIALSFIDFKDSVSIIPEGNSWLRRFLNSEAGWVYTKDVL